MINSSINLFNDFGNEIIKDETAKIRVKLLNKIYFN